MTKMDKIVIRQFVAECERHNQQIDSKDIRDAAGMLISFARIETLEHIYHDYGYHFEWYGEDLDSFLSIYHIDMDTLKVYKEGTDGYSTIIYKHEED